MDVEIDKTVPWQRVLDESKPYGEVIGPSTACRYRFEQDELYFLGDKTECDINGVQVMQDPVVKDSPTDDGLDPEPADDGDDEEFGE